MLLLVLFRLDAPAAPAPDSVAADARLQASDTYAHLPLAFEPNAGRYPGTLDYTASSKAGTVALTGQGAVLTPTGTRKHPADPITMSLPGASLAAPTRVDKLPGVVNDLRGDDSSKWVTNIPTFSKVRYENAYPGIDLDYHGTDGTLEYDFRIAPEANPNRISLDFGDADLRLAPNGDLVIGNGETAIRQAAPVAFQPSEDGRATIDSRFDLVGGQVTFDLGPYDHARPLVIDPLVLDYSTYLGGNGDDRASSIAIDSSGAAYIAGQTTSTDFDSVGRIDGDEGSIDAFISKLTPSGSGLSYSTYLGGNSTDVANSIAVDASGAAYIAGVTNSTDFNTVGPIEGDSAGSDAFISKLTPAGSALAYSTYLGGGGADSANSIAVDSSGSAYVGGNTSSTDFNTVGPYEGDQPGTDAFISKLSPAGSALTYSTYLGGDNADVANSIAIDPSGSAYVTGYTFSTDFDLVGQIEGDPPGAGPDAFISKLAPSGSALTYSTYLGGDSLDLATAIAVDPSGSAYVAGYTDSTDFDTVGPIEGDQPGTDAFISKLTPAGSALSYSTYLGGDDYDQVNAIAVDSSGSAYVAGQTDSSDFDTVGQIEGDSPTTDAFISKLTPAGSALSYSTYLGGGDVDQANAIAIDPAGSAYVAGYTASTDFDTTAQRIEGDSTGNDTFISKLDSTPETTILTGPAEGSLINDSRPAFTFSSSEASAGFQCRVDAGTFSACSSPYTLANLGDGPHAFEVRAVDNSSNADDTPASRGFTVDATAPDTRIDSGPSTTTSDATPELKFSSPDSDATSFACRIDGGSFAPCTSPVTLKSLADGPHAFEVRAGDAAGNVDASPASRTFDVKSASPPDDTACKKARASLAKAKAALKKAKKSGPESRVKKAKAKVKGARARVKKACKP